MICYWINITRFFIHISSFLCVKATIRLNYLIYQTGRECERYAPTIPLAICSAAEAVTQEEYFEYIDILEKEKENGEIPIEIVPGKSTGFSSIDTGDEVANIVKEVLEDVNNMADRDWLTMSKNILDKLNKNGYIIIKKPPTSL